MAQQTILALGLTAAPSTDIVLADGASRTVGIFAADELPGYVVCPLVIVTPGAALKVFEFDRTNPVRVISGPGTFRVLRPASPIAIGVFLES